MVLNDDVDAVVLGTAMVAALERMFDDEVKGGTEIDPAVWPARPVAQRLRELLSRAFASEL